MGIRCERCNEVLNEKTAVWLEYSQTDSKYYEEVPAGHVSQGGFSFGKACAARQLVETFTGSKLAVVLPAVVPDVEFLGFTIITSTNNDGIVLYHKPTSRHLGNYSSVDSAKEYAIRYFMIDRPAKFAKQIAARMAGSFCCHDFYVLRDALNAEGFSVPATVKPSTCGNFTITFKGKKI